MSGFDIILIVALAAFTVNGFAKGLFSKVFSLAALVVGIVIAAKYGGDVGLLLSRWTGFGSTLCGVAGIAAIFILLFIFSSMLTRGFKKISVLTAFDKLGGALFGLLE